MKRLRILAAVFAALVIVFLPEEIFSNLWEEIVWLCAIVNTMGAISGWGFITDKIIVLFPHSGAIIGFLVTNRVLSTVSLGVDALMIFVGINYGITIMFFFGSIVFFIACIIVIWFYGILIKSGYDLLFIKEIRELRENDSPHGISDRFTKWIISNNKLLFWVGSLWLESDIITLIMRKKSDISVEETLKITLPSVIWCIGFWSIVFYLGILGYEYYDQFVLFCLVVLYLVVLGYEYYICIKK